MILQYVKQKKVIITPKKPFKVSKQVSMTKSLFLYTYT